MIVTARQLEELHRDAGPDGYLILRAGTRLSPLAREWIRKRKVQIRYVESSDTLMNRNELPASVPLGRVVWWSDGDHAVAKASLMSFGNSVQLESINICSDSSHVPAAVRRAADLLLSHQADAAVLMLNSAGAATVQANRNSEIRAIVGTTVESVHVAMTAIAPNVLIVERSDRSFDQVRNIFARFLRGGVA